MPATTPSPTLITDLEDILNYARPTVEDYDRGDETTPPCYSVGFEVDVIKFRLEADLLPYVSCGWHEWREISGDYGHGIEYIVVSADVVHLRLVREDVDKHTHYVLEANIRFTEGK